MSAFSDSTSRNKYSLDERLEGNKLKRHHYFLKVCEQHVGLVRPFESLLKALNMV